MDRRDLALELRSTLGDWFKVVQLVQQGGGDDNMLQMAWNKIGDYFWERQKPTKAVQYYGQAKNVEMQVARAANWRTRTPTATLTLTPTLAPTLTLTPYQVACYYQLEDYAGLERLISTLPDGAPQLKEIGDKFASVGMSTEARTQHAHATCTCTCTCTCNRWACQPSRAAATPVPTPPPPPPRRRLQAVSAYLKSGDVKSAVDSCVRDHHWEVAVQLAETHNYPDIQKVVTPHLSPLNLYPSPSLNPHTHPNLHSGPNLHPDPHLALSLSLSLTRY